MRGAAGDLSAARRHQHLGACQCYGDPSFALRAGAKPRSGGEPAVAENELRCALDNLAASARQLDADERALLPWLDGLVTQAPAEWWTSAALCASAGRAFAELGLFERAIDYFGRLPAAGAARFPLDALEQYANCLVRRAAVLLTGGAADRAQAGRLLGEAGERIDQLLAVGRTPERLAVKAGLLKQRVLQVLAGRKARTAALEQVSGLCGEALALSDTPEGQAYALANKLAADIVLQWQGGARPPARRDEVRRGLRRLEALATELCAARTDVFSLSARADASLLGALARRRLTTDTVEAIAGALRDALSRGATKRHRESMRRTLAFLRALAGVAAPATCTPGTGGRARQTRGGRGQVKPRAPRLARRAPTSPSSSRFSARVPSSVAFASSWRSSSESRWRCLGPSVEAAAPCRARVRRRWRARASAPPRPRRRG